MALRETFAPATDLLGGGLAAVGQYWWVLFVFVGLAMAVAFVFIWKLMRDRKDQWTHVLLVRRVLQNGILSKTVEMKMRRFPLIKRAEVFELEKPLLGGYLMPELEEYSGVNEFSIILDKNNRIYTNRGEYFNPDKSSVNVSAKHAEIDISRSDLRADYQNINKTNKRIEWSQIAKAVMYSLLIMAVMIVAIVAIGEWGEAQGSRAAAENAQAEAFSNLAEAMETSQATVNTQLLIIDKLNQLYGTNNIQAVVQEASNGDSEETV